MEQLVESIFPEKEVKYATFWARFVANFVDGFFVLMSAYLAVLLLGAIFAGGIILLIVSLYGPLMEGSSRQATLGKTGMRIKVTDMNGNRITYGQAFGRHFGKMISIVIVFAGFLMMLGNGKRQTLHDRMANTLVVVE
jgi:uncharacterized RDD family membrane protein YckC